MKPEEMDKLVQKYKDTTDESKKARILKTVLDAFEGYILKFANFLEHGRCDKSDADIQHLIYMISFRSSDCDLTYRDVLNNVLQSYTRDDIVSELQLNFIRCVDLYEKREGGPGFSGYIYNYYKFTVKNWIRALSKDALNTIPVYRFEESIHDTVYVESMDFMNNLCFNENINLSNLEKYVLFLYWDKGLYDKDIARILNVSRQWVQLIRHQGEHKLKNILNVKTRT